MNVKDKKRVKQILSNKFHLAKDYIYDKKGFSAVIDYHAFISSSLELKPILNEIIVEEKISPIYLQMIVNDFIVSQMLKYEVVNNFSLPCFCTTEIDQKYKLMKNLFSFLNLDYEDYKRNPTKLYFDPNDPIINPKRDQDFYYIEKLYNEIIEKLDFGGYEILEFDSVESILYFLGNEIKISSRAQSDAHDLLNTLFKDRYKIWHNDQILTDWRFDIDRKEPKNKIYQAGKAVNRIIAQCIQVDDFLIVNTKNIAINSKYLDGKKSL